MSPMTLDKGRCIFWANTCYMNSWHYSRAASLQHFELWLGAYHQVTHNLFTMLEPQTFETVEMLLEKHNWAVLSGSQVDS